MCILFHTHKKAIRAILSIFFFSIPFFYPHTHFHPLGFFAFILLHFFLYFHLFSLLFWDSKEDCSCLCLCVLNMFWIWREKAFFVYFFSVISGSMAFSTTTIIILGNIRYKWTIWNFFFMLLSSSSVVNVSGCRLFILIEILLTIFFTKCEICHFY